MGEFAAKFRPEVDLDEFERRLRAAAPMRQPHQEEADPLAELARLVNSEAMTGRKDPFEALFRAQSAIAEERDAAQARPAEQPPAVAPYGLRDPYFAQLRGSDGHPVPEAGHDEYAHPDETYGYANEAYAADPLPGQESEQAWAEAARQQARQETHDEHAWPAAFGEAAPGEPAPRIRRKAMLGMAVIMAVGVVGVAGLLTMRHRSAHHEVVTIQPDSAPARVAPAQVESASAPEGQALFDHKGGNGVAKVVAGAEQPADLKAAVNNAQTAAGAAGVATPAPPAPSEQAAQGPQQEPQQGPQSDSLFPAARKVKTVAVRADGSVIAAGAAPAPAAPLPVTSALPSLAAGAPPPDVTPAPTSEPAAKSTQRAAALTTSAPTAAAHAKTPKALKPARTEAVQAAAGGSGGYAVQLSGEPNEADARAAAKRLSAKYSGALEGRHAVPVKATIGNRTVFRVRVIHLSEDKARSMCAAVKSAGGSCFIARD